MARRILGKTAVSMKMMIYGKEGTRKSNTAIQFATLKNRNGKPLKVLLLDTEFKAIEGFNEAWLEDKGVDFYNICEIRTRDLGLITYLSDVFTQGQPIPKLNENNEIIKDEFEMDADGNPFIADVLIMDSISVINDLLVEGRQELAKKRTNIKIVRDGLFGDEKELALENAGLQFLDYAKLKSKALKMVRDLQAVTGKHVIYIARAKDAKESKLVSGKMEILDLGYELMDATSFKFLPYEVGVIIHTKLGQDGIVEYYIEKDSTGVKNQGETLYDFDIKEYENYMNNKNRTELLKQQDYNKILNVAETFTEDAELADNDIKFKLFKEVIGYAKTNPNIAKPIMAKYCKEHKIPLQNLGSPESISLNDLTELKKILNL